MIFLFLLYDILFLLGVLCYLPLYFFRRRVNFAALKGKCTLYPRTLTSPSFHKGSIWVHAVSVGEVTLLKSIIKKLTTYTPYEVIISTTTMTGQRVAEKLYPHLRTIYFPFDITLLVRRAIKKFNPKIVVLVETELWPNFFYQLKRKNIPIIILNGRISRGAYQRYKKIKFFTTRILQHLDFVGVQNEQYRSRYVSLGLPEEKIDITGNLKFTSFDVQPDELLKFKSKYVRLIEKGRELLLIAASTHYPEEEIFLEVYKNLMPRFPSLRLLIAPRHIERVSALKKLVTSYGFSSLPISSYAQARPQSKDVFILDTVGELLFFYSLADICFVGGSLIDYGGHNILEPLFFSKPTFFGPYMDNFSDIEKKVLAKKAALKVQRREDLQFVLEALLKDNNLRKELSSNAAKVFDEEKENLEENFKIIMQCLK